MKTSLRPPDNKIILKKSCPYFIYLFVLNSVKSPAPIVIQHILTFLGRFYNLIKHLSGCRGSNSRRREHSLLDVLPIVPFFIFSIFVPFSSPMCSKNPTNPRACHSWSRCNGICLAFGDTYVAGPYTSHFPVMSALTVTGSVLMQRFRLFWAGGYRMLNLTKLYQNVVILLCLRK